MEYVAFAQKAMLIRKLLNGVLESIHVGLIKYSSMEFASVSQGLLLFRIFARDVRSIKPITLNTMHADAVQAILSSMAHASSLFVEPMKSIQNLNKLASVPLAST